jgi:hypothetical protein
MKAEAARNTKKSKNLRAAHLTGKSMILKRSYLKNKESKKKKRKSKSINSILPKDLLNNKQKTRLRREKSKPKILLKYNLHLDLQKDFSL